MSIDESRLEATLDKIRSQYGEASVRKVGGNSQIERISSGDVMLDWATGGGFPMGRWIHCYGAYSSAKTLTSWNVIRNAQEKGLTCVYYNIEKQFDEEWVQKWGVDIDKLIVIDGAKIEDLGTKMESLLGVANVHIIDSIAQAVSQDELAGETGDWLPGIAARSWGKVLRRANDKFDDRNNMVIMINQTRDMFGRGGGEVATGGRMIEYLSSLSLHFRRSSWLYKDKNGIMQDDGNNTDTMTGDKEPEGIEFQVRVPKSRVSTPFRTARIRFDFEECKFDELWALTRAAIHLKAVTRGGSWYTLPDGSKVQGENGLRAALLADDDFRKSVTDKLIGMI